MWYAMVDVKSNFHGESRIFYGEELKQIAVKLEKVCDEAMEFDMSEMTFEEVDDYETEGYENYEALKQPVAEMLSSFWFRCNDVKVTVAGLAEGWDAFQQVFDDYARKKPKLKGWKLADDISEDEWSLRRLDGELQNLEDADPKKLEFFLQK